MVFRSLSDNSVVQNIMLPDNSLLVFSRKSQELYSHAIPADSSVKGVRFSLTFREISPYFLNSTCLIGDSNCWSMKFASHTKHCFGKWMPGESIHAPKINLTSWEGPSRMGLVRILELGNFMLHLVVTHFKHFIKSNYFCSPSTVLQLDSALSIFLQRGNAKH